MKLVDDKLQERLLDYLSGQEDQEARQLYLLVQRKRTKKAPYYHGIKNPMEGGADEAYDKELDLAKSLDYP